MYNIKWNKYIFRQCLAVVVLLLDSINSGAVLNLSGTLLAQLDEDDSAIEITRSEATWIASITSIGIILALLLNVGFLQIFGRKWTYFLISVSNILTWSLFAQSTEVWHLYLGRAMMGFSNGLSQATSFIFIVEVVEVKYVSKVINVGNIGLHISVLFVDIMGSYVKWQITAYVLAANATVYTAIILYLQNTHVAYLEKGEPDKAADQFFWYREKSPENWEQFKSDQNIASVKISLAELYEECKRREFLIPMGIFLWFATTCNFTGGGGMALYSIEIMREVVSMDEYLTVIISGVLGVIAALITLVILELVSVRRVINCTSIIAAPSLLLISLSLYLRSDWNGWNTVALIAIWLFNFCGTLGYANMSNILFGTLFTGVGKSCGMAIAALYINGLMFAMGHLVPTLFDAWGYSATFLFFGCCTIVCGIGAYLITPEVMGKSSEEIRKMFANYSIRNIIKQNY